MPYEKNNKLLNLYEWCTMNIVGIITTLCERKEKEMRKRVLRLVAMLLSLALIAGNGNIVNAAEVLSDASESTEEASTEESTEESESESAEEYSEENEEASEDVSEEDSEEVSEEASVPPAQESPEEISEENTEETSEEADEEVTEEESEETIETSKKYVYEDCEIDFVVTGQWENGYTVNIVIRNIGTEIIHDWTMVMEGDLDIANLWSGEIISSDEQKIIVNNLGWNQDIYPNREITLGFTSNTAYKGIPKVCTLIDKTEKVVSDGYEVIFEKTDIWNEGYTGKIIITNTSDSVIKDWRLAFESEDEIISVWDAELLENTHPSYLVGCPSHNQNIAPGQSASFGMTVSGMNPDSVITNVSLSQFTEPETEEEYDPGRELEPLQSIGEAYYKDVTEADVILNEETGILYVKNQILISGVPGEPKRLFEDLAAEIGAEIVGYLEITNDYQLEFATDKSAEELDAIIKEVKGYPYVSFASLNIASYVTSYATANDALYQDNQTTTSKVIEEKIYETGYNTNKPDNWDENLPDGDNWGLEALKVLGAWDYKEYFEPVKVGIIDSYLYSRHKDLVYDDILNQASVIDGEHGTGVAGVIAAQHNNRIGISGVATDVRLYGFDRCGKEIGESMQEKYALLNLIINDVRVINMSFGYDRIELKVGATMGNRNAIQYIDADAKIKGEFLNKLLDMGYDYVLVCAAGNDTDDYVVRDDNATYGFVPYDGDEHSYSQILEGEYVDARFGSEYTAISKWDYPDVYDRIITVGAMSHSYFATDNIIQYRVSEYSNRGARIDVVAPADNIIWTIPPQFEVNEFEYTLKGTGGTSTAAPHVTGVIALMYQANPALPGNEAKRILCENYSELITDRAYQKSDGSYYSYKLPDAERCVWNALYGESEPYFV